MKAEQGHAPNVLLGASALQPAGLGANPGAVSYYFLIWGKAVTPSVLRFLIHYLGALDTYQQALE